MALPTIGQVIRMQQLFEDDVKSERVYKTRVADINRQHLTLEDPIAEKTGTPMYAPIGTEFIVMYNSNGSDYHFRTKLVGRIEENIPLIKTSIPTAEEIIKIQKRGFFRVDANLDLAVILNQPDRNYHIITKTVDIGGGGISFYSPLEYNFILGDQLKLWCVVTMKNNSIKRIAFSGEVVRVHQQENSSSKQIVSVKFLDLKENDNLSVIRFCFERQIEIHKKHE